ncbi:putative secretory pathway GDP dissociation inhibitor 1 [Astathelohania contejeani]|uniref:Rab GDP dissociation inhibitor n=1 Tax=Astathelohania contejeani TaxID=164912 RepID=A0ABQ7I190_9MICR|nr:putative secretory pathway GDP dissociation inhibitor 1 [Thelohania contejeani]
MEDNYDYIILGTGLVECVISTILSKKGKRVLQIDHNPTYGSETRTLSYKELKDKFGQGDTLCPLLASLNRHFSIDLAPKLLLADGNMKKVLAKYEISATVSFVQIQGSYIYRNKKVYTVPASEKASLKSSAISLWQKPRVTAFFWNVKKYAETKKVPSRKTMQEEFDYYGLDKNSIEFIGHAIALNLDDEYLQKPPSQTFDKIVMYIRSLLCYNEPHPYIYPLYGLSEISQSFSRKAGMYGATFMLNTPVENIIVDDQVSVEIIHPLSKEKVAVRCSHVIGAPFYFMSRVKTTKEVIRAICIVKGEIKLVKSGQLIFLKSEFGRLNDIFMVILGEKEKTVPEGYSLAIISTVRETDNPETELKPIIDKLGDIKECFIETRKLYEPLKLYDKISILKSVDQTTHLETAYDEIVRICKELGVADELNDISEY